MATLLAGLVGGFLATIVMTVFMMGLGDDSPPPTSVFWAKYVDEGAPESFRMEGMVLHLLYGVGAGLVFAVLGPAYLDVLTFMDISTVSGGVVTGLIYGFLLFVFATIVVMNLILDMDATPSDIGMFLLFHLVYGAVLGGFIGLELITTALI